MKTVSILSPMKAPQLPFIPIEVLVSIEPGVAKARNSLANQASGDIIVMLDEDATIQNEKVWTLILSLNKGEFIMAMGRGHPITRFFAIHKTDFNQVGGFDPSLQNGEDYDFYLRATKMGLKSIILDKEDIGHVEHSRGFSLRVPWDAGKIRARHPEILEAKWFMKPNPLVFFTQLISITYHGLRKCMGKL